MAPATLPFFFLTHAYALEKIKNENSMQEINDHSNWIDQ